MKLALTVSPSFSDGFAIEVSERRKPSRGKYFVVKTKWLDLDSYVRVHQHGEVFGELRTEHDFDPADFEKLATLVDAVAVSLPKDDVICLDGTLCSLSIEKGSVLIALEWNSAVDEGWTGVSELVEFIGELYHRYRHLRG